MLNVKKETSTSETAEQSKPKRRSKLDKKHFQGFIAGILLCTIAFTGLYYGTGGQFFAGSVTKKVPVVTDDNFESIVSQSDRYVIVASSISDGDNSFTIDQWYYEIEALKFQVTNTIPGDIDVSRITLVELDPDKSKSAIKRHFPGAMHYSVFYNGVRLHSTRTQRDMFIWLYMRFMQGEF